MRRRLILGGGGSAEDEHQLLAQFAIWAGANPNVLYWPMAIPDEAGRHTACLNWVQDTLNSHGISSVTMWSSFAAHTATELSRFQAVFIGGGCTYLLLHQLKQSGFDRHLIDYLEGGGVVYGGSAGAIIFGRSIETCAHMDRNECGLADETGLDLVDGHSVACHYHSAHADILRQYVSDHGAPVVALTERSGLVIEDSVIYAWGSEPVRVIRKNRTYSISAGDTIK